MTVFLLENTNINVCTKVRTEGAGAILIPLRAKNKIAWSGNIYIFNQYKVHPLRPMNIKYY